MAHLSMKTYDFCADARHVARQPAPVRKAGADVEDGWKAYESWLEKLREQLNEKDPPLPPELTR